MSNAIIAVIKAFAPYGISGLILISIIIIVALPSGSTKRVITIFSTIMIVYGVEKIWPTLKEAPSEIPGPNLSSQGPAEGAAQTPSSPHIFWGDTRLSADWGGEDAAFSNGPYPKYRVKDSVLCDGAHFGSVAICWVDRPNGFPDRSLPNDVEGTPSEWCTYKKQSIRLWTPANGTAVPSRVYECVRTVRRPQTNL
jgi:hypothetical protein